MSETEKKSILIVEDEAIIALSEKKALEKYDYEVFIAQSGEDAIGLCDDGSCCDLILMDINLGEGIDGTEAAARILKDHDIPIIFVSSHNERIIIEKTERITSYGYIVKNSSINVFDASIKMAFKLFDANKKLKENEIRQQTMIGNISDVISIIDAEGKVKYVSPSVEKWFGWDPRDFFGPNGWITVHPDDLDRVKREFRRLLKKDNSTGSIEYRFKCKDGHYKLVKVAATNLVNYPIIDGVLINYHDITENKELENRLGTENEMFQKVLDSIPQFICWKDRKSVFLGCNKNYARMVGLPDTQSIIGKTDWDLPWKKEETEHFLIDDNQVMESDAPKYHIIEPAYDINGRETWLDTNKVPIHDIDGHVSGLIVVFSDISERKLAMEALAYDQYLLQALMNESSDHIYFKDRESKFIRTSKSQADLFGLADPAQLIGKSDFDYFAEDHARQAYEDEQSIIRTGQRVIKEEKETRAGFPAIWVLTEKMPLYDNNANVIGTFGISRDITERKNMEERLRESEIKYSNYVEKASDGIFIIDDNGSYIEVNNAACLITGYSRDELLRMHISDLVKIDSTESGLNEFRELQSKGKTSAHKRFRHKNGTTRWWAMDAVRLSERRNIAIVKDITDQKMREEEILSLLRQKEILIKEVHHRIKNNMNTICSLLSLQTSTMTDSIAIRALEDAVSRVKSMMVLYDNLYNSDNSTDVPLNEYLPNLVDQIMENFPNSSMISTRLDIGAITLDSRKMHPVGLIVNEILTNIMKYAFKGRERGSIMIHAALSGDRVLIAVQDDGNGIPEGIDFRNSPGFGLMLVSNLTDQLKGNIRIERGNGTRIILDFEK